MDHYCDRCSANTNPAYLTASACCAESLCYLCWEELGADRLRKATQEAVVADIKATGQLSAATAAQVRSDAEGRCDCGKILKKYKSVRLRRQFAGVARSVWLLLAAHHATLKPGGPTFQRAKASFEAAATQQSRSAEGEKK